MTPDPAIATAADYADAMITARRAKNIILLLLLLMLLGEVAIFFVVRYTNVLNPVLTVSTTQPVRDWTPILNFLTNTGMFLSLVLSILLGFVLLLIVNIMLVGRLIGVARVTGAYIWSIVLLLLLFPWQFFLNNVGLTIERISWKFPGVLWTWSELAAGAKFPNDPIFPDAFVHWARFVAMPLVAVLIVLAIRVKSNRGIRQALGEDEAMHTEMPA
jgi:hypothetical protein